MEAYESASMRLLDMAKRCARAGVTASRLMAASAQASVVMGHAVYVPPAKVDTRRQESMQNVKEIKRQQEIRQRDLLWARRWRDGDAQCPRCAGAEFQIVDVESDGRMRYESFRCRDVACDARWKVEFCESALVILSEGTDQDWIDLLSQSDHEL